MFIVSFVGRDPILCPFYGFWLKPKAEHFLGEDSPWKASWEKCGEKLATLSIPIFLTACSSFLQMTSQTTCRKRLVSRSIIHKTVLLPLLLLLPFLSPAPNAFFASRFTARLHYYLLNRVLKIITCSKQWKGALKENK